MIPDDLLSEDELDFEEYAQTPDPEDLIPESVQRETAGENLESRLEGGSDAVIITHTDADGFSSAALLADYVGGGDYRRQKKVIQPIDYQGAFRFEHVIETLHDIGLERTPIYIADFAIPEPDAAQPELERLIEGYDCPVAWFDHHQWEQAAIDRLESAGVDLHIDEDECTASLLARELASTHQFDGRARELAEVTKDIDLWIKDDPRSERLNVLASEVPVWDYIDVTLTHGADLPERAQDTIDDRLERDRRFEEFAVENATIETVGEWDVASTYVAGGRSSEIGNELVEADPRGADIAVVLKPNEIGYYSHSDRSGFVRCHELAGEFGGGGHPTAAGSGVPVDTFQQLARHWSEAGEMAQSQVYGAVARLQGGDAE